MLRYSLYHHSPQAMRNTLYYRPLQRLDSPTDRKNPLVQSLLSGQILPVTGTFFPQTCLQKSRFFQPLEESSRSKPAQRPKTSSQWRNHPAYRPLCVLILTATGGIRTQKAIDLTVRMDFHGTRMRSCGVHRRGVRGNLHAGPTTGIRCDALAIRRLGLLRTKTKKTARSTHGERHHGRCARPRQPITLHPRRGCAKRKPSRTISRPESRHSCTTSQTTSATGPRKRRFSNAPTRKR